MKKLTQFDEIPAIRDNKYDNTLVAPLRSPQSEASDYLVAY